MRKVKEAALSLGIMAHKGQYDLAGQPYLIHSITVANNFIGEDDNRYITAILHDVIEDSDYTLDDLRANGIPEDIIAAVDAITKKETEDYMTYIEHVKGNPIAKDVKLADLTLNMDIKGIINPSDEDFQRVEKYKQAYEYLSH
jgi:(p)ppGpp synthase/HD superfamily hydrolase